MDAEERLCSVNDSYVKARKALNLQTPRLLQSTPKPPAHVTIKKHITRFIDN